MLGDHLIRVTIAAPDFASTGVPDEWVALTVPGQFQTRYYTVRSFADGELVLDVVIHDEGLVTQWARKKFDLDPAAGADYVLHICDTTKQPRPSEHLGELVEPPVCSICFKLVKEITPQG